MAKKMLIDATHPEETRVVVLDGQKIEDFDFESTSKRQIAGNIYLAKVTRVEPSLQAAFVEYGGNRHGFLAFSEIHPDYYQIPKADRDALLAEEEAEARRYAEAAEARRAAEAASGASDEDDAEEDGDHDERDDDASDEDRSEDEDGDPTDDVGGSDGDDPGDDDPRDGGASRAMAESVGSDEDERVQEDWSADTPEGDARPLKKDEAKDAADGSATPAETAAASASSPEAAAPDPATPEAEAAKAEAPETAAARPSETPEAAVEAAQEPAVAVTTDAPDGDDAAGDASADTAWTDPESGEGEARAEGESEVDDAENGDDADGRRRRRSRRGGRSRRRRGKREDGEAEAKPADAAETPRKPSAPTDSEDSDVPAPPDAVERDAGDFMAEAISARRIAQRRYKIQEVIKVRQILLVQVVKEERGNKGAALTTYLSLAGRYCVLMPNTARGGGISRKITNAADRKKLKEIAGELEVPKGMGLIVRTAGAKRTKPEIKRDYEYLLRQWERIRETTLTSVAPTLIYEEGSLVKRVIRDLYTRDIDEILIEGEDGYREAKDYMGMLMPSHARHVKPWREQAPLYARFGVEQELDSLFNPTVQLKSGGYIVIGVTEALVAIDINSGKSTKEGSIEDTALKTNLEASDEIARQLKLRDLAGLIVIDFIDMEESRNNRAVEKRMKDRLKDDRARIQTGRISAFGLMEMSRQRLRPGMIEATTAPCGHCHGTGVVRSDGSLALNALRRLQAEAAKGRAPELLARLPLGAAAFLFNEKREHIAEIEGRFGVSVRIEADPTMVSPQFDIERVKTQTRRPAPAAPAVAPVAWSEPEPVEDAEVVETPTPAATVAAELSTDAGAGAAVAEPSEARSSDDDGDGDGDGDAGRRRRGRRGGRRRRRGDGATGGDGTAGMDVIDVAGEADPRGGGTAAPAEVAAASATATETAATAAEGAAEAEIPAPKRTRRRRKPKAEAEAAETDAGAAEPAAADPVEATKAEEAAEAPAAEEAPLLADEASVAAEVKAPDVADPEPSETAAASEAPVSETISEAVEEEAAEAEAETEKVEVEVEAEPAASSKPKRRGWWSVGG